MSRNLFRVTGRAPASVIFRRGDSITIDYTRDEMPGRLSLTTRYIQNAFDVAVPGDFAIIAEVEAHSVEEAFTWLTVGRELASIVSVATNAAISPVMGEFAYDITSGKTEREHLQRFVREDDVALSSRIVPMDAAIAVLGAIGHSSYRDRLLRAVTQYNEALLRWQAGNELLVMAHLFMGVEAITPAALSAHLEERGLARAELAAEWGYKPKGGYMGEDQFLNSEARVRLVCGGDALHHNIARRVSDDFEHGLKNGGALFAPARDALVPVARHLRQAILTVARISPEHLETLSGEPYCRPRGPGGLDHYVRSTIVGEGEELAEPGCEHPYFDWEHRIADVTLDELSWRYSFRPDHKLTARLGPGIQMKNIRYEVWDGGIFMPESAGDRNATMAE